MIHVDMAGVNTATRAINSVRINELNWIKRNIKIAAINVQRNARVACPVDTGRLRSSIKYKFYNRGTMARVYSDVEYAIYVEYGTGRYAYHGNGRQSPWLFYYDRIGRFVLTYGQKPVLMFTKAWKVEMPLLKTRVRRFGGI